MNARMPDRDIWEYAKLNNLVIVTKDSDFSERIIIETPPPRIIHFKTGNMKLSLFNEFISKHWENITDLSRINKLVNVFLDRIEGLD